MKTTTLITGSLAIVSVLAAPLSCPAGKLGAISKRSDNDMMDTSMDLDTSSQLDTLDTESKDPSIPNCVYCYPHADDGSCIAYRRHGGSGIIYCLSNPGAVKATSTAKPQMIGGGGHHTHKEKHTHKGKQTAAATGVIHTASPTPLPMTKNTAVHSGWHSASSTGKHAGKHSAVSTAVVHTVEPTKASAVVVTEFVTAVPTSKVA